ncbi:MAG: penicillin-binding transpeptidase domain-containing protein [Eubacteriales bacterium]|nr:penicillin-binding transpeptidase domain-containing protein [Eubacteriales bacterium]
MNDLKELTKRSMVVLIFSLIIISGLLVFTAKYTKNASLWVKHPANKHLYSNGQLMAERTIYDRNGKVLFETVDGSRKYNENETVRKAVMHAIGDSDGNVVTSVQVAFGERLVGWDLLNGAYRFNKQFNNYRSDMTLTLDAELCVEAFKALNGRKGTVGVYNYKTGEILCMVSSPTFDPENQPDVEAKPKKYEGVYINRLLSAAYTPGSVFKLVTSAAAIDNLKNIDTRVFHCEGEMTINGETVTCPSPHGDLSFEEALAVSCNVAFAEISLELGPDTLQKYAEKTGFNSSLKVNGIKTAIGKVNVSDAQGGDLAWAGIGQYSDTANPLNFMAYMGGVANGGVRITPRILKSNDIASFLATSISGRKRILSEETAAKLGEMMRNNVIEVYGENNYKGLELCAKTGTAEVGGGKEPHAWFAGYMNRDDFPLAFVVVIENGGSGSKVAGPVANKVLQSAVRQGDV